MKRLLTLCGLLGVSLQVSAGDLFSSNHPLEVELSGPLNTLIHHKQDEQEFSFVLSAEGLDQPVQMNARGNSRKRVCVFPPLRIEFGKNIPEQSSFSGQDDLKLVTHCHKSEKAQANTLKEYAAYQFFNLVSDAAYRTRLLNINYVDSDGKRNTQRYGFLIESTADVVKRIDGKRVKPKAISRGILDDRQEALVYVFQYLIGNTDWSMVSPEGENECCHNGKLIEKDQKLLYIPYDFDLSGLVNANYAHPDGSMRIKRVTQRLYRGFCLSPDVLRAAIQTIRSHQDHFITIINELPALSNGQRKKTRRFLDRFFNEAADEEKILESFEKRCLD